ncbi:class I poly(R)-hydroxyalkanoic acid synthase [Thalassovita mediterranea]|jgi:polyhydroxyalkanoate synthase|uniref:Poly-beta-hydroxybutyrate polymerase n=1 Tax=Thalassovita mediterranea TaxID=340021 RepID=A0A0P1GT99_9RHOB|nr:class I poly(R)-hydroxyalkanoic acid synthase [Thalassovita mediterranea]CUH85974.1 Poly-beta-hydroxybutyrate polymerase [Thalassovita mediterranea]SIS32969.1 polyhydroxyalkanoate synthase [Thalassovita mediterranea]
MTTKEVDHSADLERLEQNLARVEDLSKRFVAALARRNPPNAQLSAPDQDVFVKAAGHYWANMMQDPAKLFENQLEFWGNSVKHYLEASQALAKGKLEAPTDPTPTDRRFSNPLWQTHPYFNYVKQQYMMNADAVRTAVANVEGLGEVDRNRLKYFSEQIVDMMSPTNFLGTNPDALERAIATEGESLVKGLENLVADLEANNGEMLVRLSDESAFELGRNVATAKGSVVYRNHMMELIQYAPTTDQVHATPLVIFPPWINKFYILDLKEQNSLIRWITDQGYTLFVVSWFNPRPEDKDIGMEDYIEQGYLEAFRVVKEITGEKQVNTVGYCIAGTTLHLTLALLKKRGDKTVKSATFFTALTDFGEQGEFTPFLQDDFVDGIEDEVAQQGILRSFIMGRTMSFLRSNDLIYGPAIKSYMMGEAPPAFDLLYWNGDGSNLPGRMVMQYLRGLCQGNEFVGDGYKVLGETLHVSDVDIPLMSVTCETDHIARWKDCYRGFQQTGAKNRTFIVSQSGHIAGIVNPPSKKKYGHYTNTDLDADANGWMEGATFHEGSWWPRWEAWLDKKSGKMVPARVPGDSGYPALDPAPGRYVAVKATI